jgi:ATP-dependent DNA helicase RecQ
VLDRVALEQALRSFDWSSASQCLASASQAAEYESERWRLSAMAACARVLAEVESDRDATAQVRELVRLADGHIAVAAPLLQRLPALRYTDFALRVHHDDSERVLMELGTNHPAFDSVPGLERAIHVDPQYRRNVRDEPASTFLRRLSAHFRFVSDGQKAALHALMTMPRGATLVASLPTGWGKSALFQVGARRWREADPSACVVVVVPTVALAQDHARSLSTMPGLEGSRSLVGGMTPAERQQTLSAFSMGEIPILLMSPEMALGTALGPLREAATRGANGVEGGHLTAVVIDEAHIIASWGRYFRPDFQRLPGLVRELRQRQPDLRTLLLSATIDESLRRRFRDEFGGTEATDEVVVAEPRNEFDLVWSHTPPGTDRTNLVVQAADVIPRPAIIYTTTVEDAELLHKRLCERGYKRLAIFTGEISNPAERQQILHAWAQGDLDLVVATSAFGMGVDKPNVRAIAHACLPENADRLYQEIGRGGRDGHQALSLCLWTDSDAMTAANLAIHGWMRPATSAKRWRAILREARTRGLFNPGPNGSLQIKVPLDARHDDLERITGQLNRQWNAALLTLLQRSGALQIVGEDSTEVGNELWVAEILRPEIVSEGPGMDGLLAPYLSIGESEASSARKKAAELEERLVNESERCLREALFELVEPAGSSWPCGRCDVCIEAGEHPRSEPSRHELHTAWSFQEWTRPCGLAGGAVVVNPEDPALIAHLDQLVARLAGIGIQQFVTTEDAICAVERSVTGPPIDLGFTLLLGGSIPPARVPTAVIVGNGGRYTEALRRNCMVLRLQFEEHWRELPLVFVLPSDITGQGALLSQHLTSQAPMAERELEGLGGDT